MVCIRDMFYQVFIKMYTHTQSYTPLEHFCLSFRLQRFESEEIYFFAICYFFYNKSPKILLGLIQPLIMSSWLMSFLSVRSSRSKPKPRGWKKKVEIESPLAVQREPICKATTSRRHVGRQHAMWKVVEASWERYQNSAEELNLSERNIPRVDEVSI